MRRVRLMASSLKSEDSDSSDEESWITAGEYFQETLDFYDYTLPQLYSSTETDSDSEKWKQNRKIKRKKYREDLYFRYRFGRPPPLTANAVLLFNILVTQWLLLILFLDFSLLIMTIYNPTALKVHATIIMIAVSLKMFNYVSPFTERWEAFKRLNRIIISKLRQKHRKYLKYMNMAALVFSLPIYILTNENSETSGLQNIIGILLLGLTYDFYNYFRHNIPISRVTRISFPIFVSVTTLHTLFFNNAKINFHPGVLEGLKVTMLAYSFAMAVFIAIRTSAARRMRYR